MGSPLWDLKLTRFQQLPKISDFPSVAPVGCDLRDLGSPSLHRNLQNRWHRILNMHRNLFRDFDLFDGLPLFFLLPRLTRLLSWDLGSAFCALVDWDEALGSLAVRGTPCPHGLRPMRCKICCCCEHGRLRGQCKECGGSSSSLRAPAAALLLQLQGVWRQQLLRAQTAAQPVQGVWPQQLLRAWAPARLLQL